MAGKFPSDKTSDKQTSTHGRRRDRVHDKLHSDSDSFKDQLNPLKQMKEAAKDGIAETDSSPKKDEGPASLADKSAALASKGVKKGVKKAGKWAIMDLLTSSSSFLIPLLMVLGIAAAITGTMIFPQTTSFPVVMVDTPCYDPEEPKARDLKEGDPDGDWTEEGSAAYYRAEWLFNWFIDRGFSGWGAAGAVGNVAIESDGSFHPAIAESKTKQMEGLGVDAVFPGAREVGGRMYHLNAREIKGVNDVGGGWGPYQWTPAQVMTDDAHDGVNGYEYIGAWDDLGESWKSMAQDQFEEVLYDVSRVEDMLTVHQAYLWLAHDGASMGTNGLQKVLLESDEWFSKIAGASNAEDATFNFYHKVEHGGIDRASFLSPGSEVHGSGRVEAAEKAYDLFEGDKYPNADRSRIEEEWSADVTPRSPTNPALEKLPPCKPEKPQQSGSILDIARALIGHWHYRQGVDKKVLGVGPDLPFLSDGRNSPYYMSPGDKNSSDREHFSTDDGTDCSGFVSMVLYWAGTEEIKDRMGDQNTPGKGTANNLHTVDTFAGEVGGLKADKSKFDKHDEYEVIPASEAKAGDTIHNPSWIAGGFAHSAILSEDWHGPSTLIIQMGGGEGEQYNKVNEAPAGSAGFSNSSIFIRVTPSGESRIPEGLEVTGDSGNPGSKNKSKKGNKDRSEIVGTTAHATGTTSKAGAVSTNGYHAGALKNFKINAKNPSHITGAYLDDFLRSHYPDSPLIGHGNQILKYSEQYGVNVGVYMGQIAKETTFGRNSCGGRYNFGCITWTPGSQFGKKYAAGRAWIDPPSVDAGIEAQFKLVRENYIDKGYDTYGKYLERYSPSFENDHSSFESLAYGTMNALAIPH